MRRTLPDPSSLENVRGSSGFSRLASGSLPLPTLPTPLRLCYFFFDGIGTRYGALLTGFWCETILMFGGCYCVTGDDVCKGMFVITETHLSYGSDAVDTVEFIKTTIGT